MEKSDALKRIAVLESETAELRKIIENADKPKNIMDRVKTFTDACNVLGINPTQVTNNSLDTNDEIAYKKLKIICKALNEGWEPDWNNINQIKYFPWFDMGKKVGEGFADSDCSSWDGYSGVPSRLAYKTKELSAYAAKQFESEYYNYLVI